MKTTPNTFLSLRDIPRTRAVIVLHYYTTGPGQELHDWLKQRGAEESVLIEHPFIFSARTWARVDVCRQGAGCAEQRLPRRRWPMAIRYALDFLRTIRLVLAQKGTYDLYVGNGCFDTVPGLILRYLGKVRTVVLYTIDYAPNAAGTRFHAWLYRLLDRFCCYRVNAIWDLSHRMMPARHRDGHRPERCAPSVWVPHGNHARALARTLPADADPCRIAFMGHIQEKSGLQLVFEAMAEARREFPSLHLDVVGDGPYRPNLQQLAERLGLTDCVRFHGYVERHEDLERMLSACGIGLALYNPETSDYSFLADPGKPKVYMACGLPVVISDVPEVAALIEERGAGKRVAYDKAALLDALRSIMSDHKEYRARARRLADEFDWDVVFVRAWQQTPSSLSDFRPPIC